MVFENRVTFISPALSQFITVFARACCWSLTWARRIQSTHSHTISLRFILILSSIYV